MSFLHFRLFIAWLVLLIVATPVPAQVLAKATPEQVGFSPQRLKRLTEVFEAYVADRKLAGSVVLVARRGKIAYLHAFGSEIGKPTPRCRRMPSSA